MTARARWTTLVLVSPLVCFAASPKLAPDLDGLNPDSTPNVIIQFDRIQGSPRAEIARLGGIFQADLNFINAGIYSVPAKALTRLANLPGVVYVSPDRQVAATLDYANPTVGAPSALPLWDGTGVGVAIIDSGILPETDLLDTSTSASNVSRVVYSQSFLPKVTSTADQYGHGTHVAGIVAGNGTASTGSAYFKTFRGIAPNARLINLRVLDANGVGTDSSVINAIGVAIQLKNKYNIRVINLSLGRPVFESYTQDPLCQAVEHAWTSGIVVVVAAGNAGRNQSQGTNGYGTITAPGNDPLVITVGAMKTMSTSSRTDDQIASYSSKGPTLIDHVVKPDLVAPGNRIISLLALKTLIVSNSNVNKILYSYYQNTLSKSYSGDYYRLSGTSMAAPMVSGAAAVMLTKDWSLTPDKIKARLMKTATKTFPAYSTAVDPVTNTSYTSQYDIFTIGAGYLNITDALNSSDDVSQSSTAASPTAVFDPSTNTVRVVNTNTAVWGTVAIWGTTAVWGTAAVWGTTVFVDGAAAVWGTSALWGSSAVWGTSGTQGNSAVWGTAAIWGTSSSPGGETLSLLTNGEN